MTASPQVPGYVLHDPLGAGAGGTVYDAVSTGESPDSPPAGTPVAVKVIEVGVLRGRAAVDRWRREARLASKVDHPGVVRVFDTGSDDDRAWIVMSRLTGPDLRRSLSSGQGLPTDEAASVVGAIADAMAAVHAAGLVHRDLKPGNVVLDDGAPTIVDFGLARSVADIDPTGGLTASHEAAWARTATSATSATTGGPGTAGTFAWMAPEQWRGDDVGPAADVYALGGLLFSALTGQAPYPKETLTELAYSVALDAPPRPSEHGGDPRFDGVVAVAMAKDPADRFPDAAAFGAALRAVAAGVDLPLPEPARAPAAPVAHAAGRGRYVLGGSALGLLAVAAAIVALVLLRGGDGDSDGGSDGHGPSVGTVLTVCAEHELTLRPEPGSNDDITAYRHGAQLTVEADDRSTGVWVKVKGPDGQEGFVLTEYAKQVCPG